MLKKLWKRKRDGFITVEVPFAMLLFMFIIIFALAATHSIIVRSYVNTDMNSFLQSVRMHGYAPADQVDGVAHILAESRGYPVEDVKDSLIISRVNSSGHLVGSSNSLNGAVHGELAPEDRVERGSGEYILIELQYETDDDWWANVNSMIGIDSNMEKVTYNRRIGSEYYNPDAEWTGGGVVPND